MYTTSQAPTTYQACVYNLVSGDCKDQFVDYKYAYVPGSGTDLSFIRFLVACDFFFIVLKFLFVVLLLIVLV